MTRHITVLGGGVAGLSTAYFLADQPNVAVTLVEREPRHDAHSSGRSAEILRTAIDDPITRTLAIETGELLRAPSRVGLDLAAPLVDGRGLIVWTHAETPAWLPDHESAGLASEIAASEAKRLAPHFTQSGTRAFWFPSGGRIERGQLISSLAAGAASRGVRVIRSAGAARPIVRDGVAVGVALEGSAGPVQLRSDDVVIAAGAWSSSIGASIGLGLPLRTTRRHMVAATASHAAPMNAPVVWDDSSGFYVRPEPFGLPQWICSATDLDEVDPGFAHHPARQSYQVEPSIVEEAYLDARQHLEGEPLAPLRAWRGFRDLTPDDRPIFGPDPRMEGLHWCAGLGGHGLTVSLAAGRAAAGLILGRGSEVARCAGLSRPALEFVSSTE